MSIAPNRAATYAAFYQSAPQQETAGNKTWVTRGANFVVAVSQVAAGAVLTRDEQPDEYFVFLPEVGATIRAGDETIVAAADTLTIVPPGASSITAQAAGYVVRVFSNVAADLLALCSNKDTYAGGALDVAPLVPWPAPPAGYKLRNYVLADHVKAGSNMRIFRSTNLMINVLNKRTEPRDVHKLSPHSHTDFEQGSLAMQGTYVHHLKFPWSVDMTTWLPDEHVEVASPSLAVIPPKVVHTSMNVSEGDCWLIDIFSPPRLDFSNKPGMVCNADEYPMPA